MPTTISTAPIPADRLRSFRPAGRVGSAHVSPSPAWVHEDSQRPRQSWRDHSSLGAQPGLATPEPSTVAKGECTSDRDGSSCPALPQVRPTVVIRAGGSRRCVGCLTTRPPRGLGATTGGWHPWNAGQAHHDHRPQDRHGSTTPLPGRRDDSRHHQNRSGGAR
jgi:hypothetical protein